MSKENRKEGLFFTAPTLQVFREDKPLAFLALSDAEWTSICYVDYIDVDAQGEIDARFVDKYPASACDALRSILRAKLPMLYARKAAR